MEIQKVICLSTAHVTQDDMNGTLNAKYAHQNESALDQPIFAAKHQYGAFVYIPQRKAGVEQLIEDALEFGYSESFAKLLRYGAKHKARYIHLDCDGPIDAWQVQCEELDEHEW